MHGVVLDIVVVVVCCVFVVDIMCVVFPGIIYWVLCVVDYSLTSALG